MGNEALEMWNSLIHHSIALEFLFLCVLGWMVFTSEVAWNTEQIDVSYRLVYYRLLWRGGKLCREGWEFCVSFFVPGTCEWDGCSWCTVDEGKPHGLSKSLPPFNSHQHPVSIYVRCINLKYDKWREVLRGDAMQIFLSSSNLCLKSFWNCSLFLILKKKIVLTIEFWILMSETLTLTWLSGHVWQGVERENKWLYFRMYDKCFMTSTSFWYHVLSCFIYT